MTYTEQAIQRAIEGGYQDNNLILWCVNSQTDAPLFLDLLFWQSLGKSLGWSTSCYHNHGEDGWSEYRHVFKSCGKEECMALWMLKQHRFIDHLIAGKDAESFFKSLLDEAGGK